MEEMEKSHNSFLQGAQQELKKEMAILQKKILIDTVSAEVKEGWSSLSCAVGYESVSFYAPKPIEMASFQCLLELI